MNKSSTDILNEKVDLIYEYDDRSPLFVRVANFEIEKNNLDSAVEILNKGLELYPNYATAYMVLGKAFLLKGDYENSNECFKTGSDLLHSARSYNYYLNDLETIKKQRSPFQNLKIQDFVKTKIDSEPKSDFSISNFQDRLKERKDTRIPDQFEDLLPDEDLSDSPSDNKVLPSTENSIFESRLEEIAHNLSSVKIQPEPQKDNEPEKSQPPQVKKIVPSETLAKIYISQGEFREAIDVYKKLLLAEPSKRLYYTSRIKEIEDQLDINHF